MGLFDGLIELGLKGYDKLNDRSKLPSNKRIFLETILDGKKDKITEKDLTPEERQALVGLIQGKYEMYREGLKPYLEQLGGKLKDKSLDAETRKKYQEEFKALSDFDQGKLTPDFINLVAKSASFAPQPRVMYEDYDKGGEGRLALDARTVMGNTGPLQSLSTLLGRFTFSTDPEGKIYIKDSYDFNSNAGQSSPGPYQVLREYAGRKMPPGSGRPVEIVLDPRFKDPFGDTTK